MGTLFLKNFLQFSAFYLFCGLSIVDYILLHTQMHVLRELSKHRAKCQIQMIERCEDSGVCFEFFQCCVANKTVDFRKPTYYAATSDILQILIAIKCIFYELWIFSDIFHLDILEEIH